jgi:membrane protein DedA with SNARE-associated domain
MLSLIAPYGYLVVFLGVLLESVGIPLLGETILIALGVMVQRGHLDLRDAKLFGILRAVVEDRLLGWP